MVRIDHERKYADLLIISSSFEMATVMKGLTNLLLKSDKKYLCICFKVDNLWQLVIEIRNLTNVILTEDELT